MGRSFPSPLKFGRSDLRVKPANFCLGLTQRRLVIQIAFRRLGTGILAESARASCPPTSQAIAYWLFMLRIRNLS